MNKGRLEAFTDAIVAIAATIMVLELHVPETPDLKGFLSEGPTFIAYLVSFLMIFSVWYSHHNLFIKAENITPRTYLFNGLWMLTVTLFPLVTAWVGNAPAYVVPEMVYELDQFLCMIAFALLTWQVRKDNPEMERPSSGIAAKAAPYFMYIICMAIIPFYPPIALWVTGISAIVVLGYIFFSKSQEVK